MHSGKRSTSIIYKRCEKLEALGFEISHLDSSVEMRGYNFDFSAVDVDSIQSVIAHVISEVEKRAIEYGENSLRKKLQNLLLG